MYPASDGTFLPFASTVAVVKVRSLATPLESVTADPAAPPLASRRLTVAPTTEFVSALRVTSRVRMRVNLPGPVTSTESTSTVPSTYSTIELPVITMSWELAMVMSVRVNSPEPAVSIPTAFVEIVMPSMVTAFAVF